MALLRRAKAMARGIQLEICAAIEQRGFAIEASFLPQTAIMALGAEARRRDAAGEFHPAGIGRAKGRVERSDIRGDRILWLDEHPGCVAEMSLTEALESLRVSLNRALFLGLDWFEGHYAIYPPGAFYRRHRDRFEDDDARVISCVLYLNEAWAVEDGGALRIHLDPGARDILPIGGTLVCFASELEHEVLPSARARLAVTGWFRRRA
jgi:SM-20-related protein